MSEVDASLSRGCLRTLPVIRRVSFSVVHDRFFRLESWEWIRYTTMYMASCVDDLVMFLEHDPISKHRYASCREKHMAGVYDGDFYSGCDVVVEMRRVQGNAPSLDRIPSS